MLNIQKWFLLQTGKDITKFRYTKNWLCGRVEVAQV